MKKVECIVTRLDGEKVKAVRVNKPMANRAFDKGRVVFVTGNNLRPDNSLREPFAFCEKTCRELYYRCRGVLSFREAIEAYDEWIIRKGYHSYRPYWFWIEDGTDNHTKRE